jgi:hypothetical protein
MFAPMGDGKTFPILSIVCASLSVAAILVADGYSAGHISEKLICEAARKIRVFGDDIAGRSEYYGCVCRALESHNLKVNVGKSFSRGRFREACGFDSFKGVDVTPLRQRVDLDQKMDGHSLEKAVALHNRNAVKFPRLFRTMGYLKASIVSQAPDVGLTLDSERNPMSLVASESEYRKMLFSHKARWNPDLQRVEVRVLVRRDVSEFYPSIDSWWDLSYRLRTMPHTRTSDWPSDHLSVTGSPADTKLLNLLIKKMAELGPGPYGWFRTSRTLSVPHSRLGYVWSAYEL